MSPSRVYIPLSADDAQGLLEDGIGTVVILLGDSRTRATSACLSALENLAEGYDPDSVMFAHVDPRLLPEGCRGREAFPTAQKDGSPTILCTRDGEIIDASVGRQCCARLRRQVDRLLRNDPGPSLLTRFFRFASGA